MNTRATTTTAPRPGSQHRTGSGQGHNGRSPEPIATQTQPTNTTHQGPRQQTTPTTPDYYDNVVCASRGWGSEVTPVATTPIQSSGGGGGGSTRPTPVPAAAAPMTANVSHVRSAITHYLVSAGVPPGSDTLQKLVDGLISQVITVTSEAAVSTPEASFDGRSTIVEEVCLAQNAGRNQMEFGNNLERPSAPSFQLLGHEANLPPPRGYPTHPRAARPKPAGHGKDPLPQDRKWIPKIHLDPNGGLPTRTATQMHRRTLARHVHSAFATCSRSSDGNWSSYSDTASTTTTNTKPNPI